MKFIQQRPNECLLASICQIDDNLDYEKEKEKFKYSKDWQIMIDWTKKQFPNMPQMASGIEEV